jgi:large subunit ribosomal protein L17e
MAILGLKLTKAYTYLGNVVKHDEVIPFRRFAGGIGRTGQAKQFKTTKGALLSRLICGSGTDATVVVC